MSKRIPSLDGLRTLSIGMVFLGHLYGTQRFPQNEFTRATAQYAHLGVQVFFVISGFLITSLLMKELEASGRIDLGAFYVRRTLRIFPAAFAYITIIAIVAHPGYLAYAYTYLMCYAGQGRPWLLGHLWSLSVEEQFYLLWPFAFLFASRKRIGWIVMLSAPIARLIFWHFNLHDIDEYFPAVADSLMAGCLLAMYRDKVSERLRIVCSGWAFASLGLLVLATPFVFTRVRFSILLGGLIPLVIALFIHAAIERRDWFLNNRFTYCGGLLSYSLYLWQQPFLNRNHPAWWTAFPVNIVLTLGCAVGSYFLVEIPFQKLRRYQMEKKPVFVCVEDKAVTVHATEAGAIHERDLLVLSGKSARVERGDRYVWPNQ